MAKRQRCYRPSTDNDIIIKRLLSTGGVDLKSTDTYDQTVLSWTEASGHLEMAKLLGETEQAEQDVSSDEKKVSHSPKILSQAVRDGNEAAVTLLLRHISPQCRE
jgi:ankyrin repeat protein